MVDERRHDSRTSKRLRVEFGESSLNHHGFTKDLSVGGLFLIASRLLDPDARIHLHIFSDESGFFAEGRVARLYRVPPELRELEKQGMGVRFLETSELVRELVPAEHRKKDKIEVRCRTKEQLTDLLRDQLSGGVLMVEAPREAGHQAIVEFEVRLEFLEAPQNFDGVGRVIQVLTGKTSKSHHNVVLEVRDAAILLHKLAVAMSQE